MSLRACVIAIVATVALAANAQDAPPVVQETHAMQLGSAQRDVDIYRPSASPVGVAIVAHGFARSRARHRDLGRALAEAGIVAVVPDLPSVMNLWSNGDALAELEKRLEEGALPSLRVARNRVVLVGTSAGGLAAVLAAAQLSGVAGWIGLDPVDGTGTGAAAASRVSAPGVVLLAEPSLCNLMSSGRGIAEALPRRWRTVEIGEASHCDFEDPTNNLCEAMCGRSSEGARSQIRAEIVTTALEMLARPATPEPGAKRATTTESAP